MTSYDAIEVHADTDSVNYGYGDISFRWADAIFGHDGLSIDLDGFTSRGRGRCGQGPPEFVELQRDRVKLRFEPALARQLELDAEIEIRFAIGEYRFCQVRRAVGYFQGIWSPEEKPAPPREGSGLEFIKAIGEAVRALVFISP